MYGLIYFTTLEELATFLHEYAGGTATFTVKKNETGMWELEFTGGI